VSKLENSRKQTKRQGERQETGETRRLILQAAQNLFMTYGYRAVTTRQIADACGITQAALYRHFTDKQDIYVSMLLETMIPSRSALERIAQRSAPLHERLRLAALHLLHTSQHNMDMMFHDVQHELKVEAQEKIQHAFEESVLHPLASIFEDGMRQGLLRPPEEAGITALTAAGLFLRLSSEFVSQNSYSSEPARTLAERAQLVAELTLYGCARYDAPDQHTQ